MEDKVLEMMKEVFEIDDITTDVSQKNCERWDSLHHLTLASELEDAFDVELEPEEIGQMTDFAKVIDVLRKKL